MNPRFKIVEGKARHIMIPPNKRTHNKNKLTRRFLEMFLEGLKKVQPALADRYMYLTFWKFRKELKAEGYADYETKANRTFSNASCRIVYAAAYLSPQLTENKLWEYMGTITMERYIHIVQAAIDLPKEYCDDYPTNS